MSHEAQRSFNWAAFAEDCACEHEQPQGQSDDERACLLSHIDRTAARTHKASIAMTIMLGIRIEASPLRSNDSELPDKGSSETVH